VLLKERGASVLFNEVDEAQRTHVQHGKAQSPPNSRLTSSLSSPLVAVSSI
jgi:hypothetical protein